MFQTLLSPLRSRFDLSPRSPTFQGTETASPRSLLSPPGTSGAYGSFGVEPDVIPEDFARDVLIQLMRNAVEDMKVRGTEPPDAGLRGRMEILSEVNRIIQQDAVTKDIFREMDGFLSLMSVLASLSIGVHNNEEAASPATPILVEPVSQLQEDMQECVKLVFVVLSEAMEGSVENEVYFRTKVGYESLKLALQSLPESMRPHILSFLLCLSLADFSPPFATYFVDLKEAAGIDQTIKYPGAVKILWELVEESDNATRFSLYKLFELLFSASHRNGTILSSLEIVGAVFRRLKEAKEKEKQILQKLLRKLLEIGASTAEARSLFQAAVQVANQDKLDLDVLDVIRFGMKSRWVEHFSMEGTAGITLQSVNPDARWKTLPKEGMSFFMWFFPSTLPPAKCALFSASSAGRPLMTLFLLPDGKLSMLSNAAPEGLAVFTTSKVKKGRWSQISFVWYPKRGSNPNLRLYIDGVFIEGMSLPYPRTDSVSGAYPGVKYLIGDLNSSSPATAKMSWCIASAYLLGAPLADDLPRLIHHLGPRYTGSFQDPELVKFLTYEASTSLNMYLGSSALSQHLRSPHTPGSSSMKGKQALTPIVKALREGMSAVGIKEEALLFVVAPDEFEPGVDREMGSRSEKDAVGVEAGLRGIRKGSPGRGSVDAALVGDVFVVQAESLDVALWKIGGAAVGLRLVQLASTPHELSRTLGILTDGLKNSWQNSEDMERLRGYEILADILRNKAHLINLTAFETLFEFMGVNFSSPEQSTIVNALAYRAIALDFALWSRTRVEIQRVHLEQFSTLLSTSRFKAFNWKQRLSKVNLVRKLLFALQADWYDTKIERAEGAEEGPSRMLGYLIDSLDVALRAPGSFSKEDIKAVVAYLAANLHESASVFAGDNGGGENSPHSIISRFEFRIPPREKAEQVLALLVQTLSSHPHYLKFTSALPITRIILLLLGDRPSSFVARQILILIAISIKISNAFSRKFELVSGWNVLKTIVPAAWDTGVNQAAFDLLLGTGNVIVMGSQAPTPTSATRREQKDKAKNPAVSCTQILPTIISALQTGLLSVANNCHISEDSEAAANVSWTTEATMEMLIEELLTLHASSSTFRHLFESQQTTQLFVDAYKSMVSKLSGAPSINDWNLRILEKLTHFGLALALDNAVGGAQKREILDKIQSAESILNPTAGNTVIDPNLMVDNRSVRQRFASARFSIQLGDRTVTKTIARMTDWRKTVQVSERKRLRKTFLDMKENRRQVSRLTEWTHLLTSERGLWPHNDPILWRLDETEGPHRIRKKLEPQNDISPSSRVDGLEETTRSVNPPDSEAASMMHVEVPPWAESYEISATEVDDRQQLADDVVDDKLRRVRHELEPGDVIEAVATVARIDGVDSSPGLLILGRTHVYMLDGVVENEEGEVIDAHDAPKRLLFVPGSIVELNGPQRAQRWPHSQIGTCSDKKFLFRDVALEIYFKDSRSLLIVFLDKKRRSDLEQRLSMIMGRPYSEIGITPGPHNPQRTPMFGRMSSRMLSGFRSDELSTATRKWQAREISNFAYLSILNQISGRTPSDATQYPIFPWVLSDYTSQILDLNNPASYRDLTKPMGALTPARRQAAETRYSNLESVGEVPFHYGTHFSSSMIVCHFLIRLAPFTNMFKTLQGGDWDLPDRLFSDLPRAYESAAHDIRGDVRELIPEFFTCPEFLENSANHDFGSLQQTGEKIHDVKLPPWAREDPLLFISLNRKALESPIVSEQLPAWIDLIWGCKQRDPTALNVFHPLSYEGSIDLDSIKDDLEREATVGIIHNFGQTPRKIFSAPHPERYHHGLYSLPLGTLHGIEEDPHLLTQNTRCFKDLGPTVPVRELVPDVMAEKMIPCPEGVLCVPQYPHEHIEWGSGSAELRVVVDHKVVQVIESAFSTCAAFADPNSLVTGSSDYTVRLWKTTRPNANSTQSGLRLTLSHIMRVHTDEVVCIAASRAWSLVVSGSKDGSAAVWDLNRGVYVRSIWHGDGEESSAVNLVAINESTGYIATCSRLKLCLHTVNGRPIAILDLTKTSSFSPMVPTITSMAFLEREYSHLGVLATGGPDGTITLRTWTADGTPEGEKAIWEFLTIRTMKVRMVGHNRPPAITALKFLGESLYHGEETGKSYLWSLPDN